MRLEGELGYVEGKSSGSRVSRAHLGIGAFCLVPTLPGVQAYYGGRLQYEWLTESDTSLDAFRVAAAVGGEWRPVPAVAFGVEGQLGYTDRKASAPAISGPVSRGVATSTLVFLRVFPGQSSPGSSSAAPPAGPRKATPRQRCEGWADCTGGGVCVEGYCRR